LISLVTFPWTIPLSSRCLRLPRHEIMFNMLSKEILINVYAFPLRIHKLLRYNRSLLKTFTNCCPIPWGHFIFMPTQANRTDFIRGHGVEVEFGGWRQYSQLFVYINCCRKCCDFMFFSLLWGQQLIGEICSASELFLLTTYAETCPSLDYLNLIQRRYLKKNT